MKDGTKSKREILIYIGKAFGLVLEKDLVENLTLHSRELLH